MADKRLRIIVAKPGLDGHDRGAKIIARALRDAGFEVIYTGLHQTPEMIAEATVQEDADAVGLSVLSGAHMTLFPEVLRLLKEKGADDVAIFGGGIIPEEDAVKLKQMGVREIFTPGASTEDIVKWVNANVSRANDEPPVGVPMNFEMTEEHRRIRDTLTTFAEREIKPHSTEWDKKEVFPRHVIEHLGELGFLGVAFPEKWGGGGADTLSQVLVVEGLSRFDASIGLTAAAHMSLSTGHIANFASDEHRDHYVPDMLAAKKIGAWCLTEPNSGSDAAAMLTRANRVGDNYVINGSKMFITNGSVGDVFVVTAKTAPDKGRGGISAFIVDRGTAGMSNGKRIEKLGLRASDTAEVIFENVTVPARNLIGELGAGYSQAMKILEGGRIGIAGFAAGIARGGFEEAKSYAMERRQFDQRIADFQAIQFMIADMATRIDASWMLICRAAQLKDRGKPFAREAAMAKLFASEVAMWTTTKAVQIHGGYGYVTDFPVERYMRDAKLAEIGEGTSEVQRMLIAKSLLRDGYTPA